VRVLVAFLLLGPAQAGGVAGEPGLIPSGRDISTDSVNSYRIVEDESLLAVVTLRAGVAGRFAHDHLIHAGRYEAELTLDPDEPERSRLALTVPTEELVVDDGTWHEEVQDRLQELGIMDGPFQDTDAGEREEIREAMLGSDQLEAGAYPEIRLTTGEIRSGEDPEFPWEVEVVLTVRDEERREWAQARLEREDGRILVEGHATFRFTHFGIEPYSAYLGLVRTRDPFHLYLRMVAEPTEEP
jgi:polyisoprenoid-binding protein YceI